MIRRYKFRVYPSKSQKIIMNENLELCRNLYNVCLEQRINAYKQKGISISRFDQSNELPNLKEQLQEYKQPFAKSLCDVVQRLDIAFKKFFIRINCKKKSPGFPRFKSKDRYHSFTYYQAGWKLEGKKIKLYLAKIGWMKIKQWKQLPVEVKVKQVIVKKEVDRWFVILTYSGIEPKILPKTGKVIGIDLGLKNLVTTSDGEVLGDLEHLKKKELKIRKLHQNLDKKKRGSTRRKKAKFVLLKAYQYLVRSRKYQLDCISKKLIKENDLIAIEDLNIQQLSNQKIKGQKGKNIRRTYNQAALGELTRQLIYKAEEAGRSLVRVNPKGTSQECSNCGKLVPKDLNVRVHSCSYCGLTIDRDHNAAINVLNRALQAQHLKDEEFSSRNKQLNCLISKENMYEDKTEPSSDNTSNSPNK